MSSLLFVLKEPDAKFNPQLQQTLFRPANIIAATFLAKLTPDLFKNWVGNTGLKSGIYLDSCIGHYLDFLNIYGQTLTIPKKTAGVIQPVGVYGIYTTNF